MLYYIVFVKFTSLSSAGFICAVSSAHRARGIQSNGLRSNVDDKTSKKCICRREMQRNVMVQG